MVVCVIPQELLEESSKLSVLTLPSYKTSSLKLNFDDPRDSKDTELQYNNGSPVLPFAESNLLDAKVTNWRRLTADNDECKPIYEVTFDIQESNLQYKAGDTVGVLPQNPKMDVGFIINHLNIKSEGKQPYKLSCEGGKGTKIPPHIPTKSTIQHVLTHCIDLRSPLKKLFLLTLSKYTQDKNERHVLEYLSSKEGATSYSHYILEKNTCILDIFRIYKSCQPPIQVLLVNLPRLLPRPYSIIYNSSLNNNQIKICFSVMNVGNNRKGLTTSYLEDILLSRTIESQMGSLNISNSKENTIKIYLRRNMNGFLLPETVDTPLLLIGPGTGVSPFIGFLEERKTLRASDPEVKIGAAWLIFGCRNPKLDFLYEKELNHYIECKALDKLSIAFSRVEYSKDCKYVQDCIKNYSKEIAEFIQSGACIYVCGDLKSMAVEVKKAIKESIVEHLNKSETDADLFITTMEKDKKYISDIWS